MPPTLEEVEAFENDQSPNAWEKVVDRLLASPHYGEKWARHWLDLVRYAESNGFERDSDKPHIWRYRDYVIDAFNADVPYDRFLLEQLAGDEIENPTASSMIATGLHRLMQWDDEPADRLQHLFDNLDDNVRIIGEGMLGMTIGCARCHDHKGDPFSQEDYYSFMAFFRGVKQPGKGNANIEKVGGGGDEAYQAALRKHEETGERQVAELDAVEQRIGAQLIKAFPSLRGRLHEGESAGTLKDPRRGRARGEARGVALHDHPARGQLVGGRLPRRERELEKGQGGLRARGNSRREDQHRLGAAESLGPRPPSFSSRFRSSSGFPSFMTRTSSCS